MLGSSSLEIVCSDWDASRIQKIEAISKWKEGCRHLRVCFSSPDPTKNCGRCSKCLRTMMEFYFATGDIPPVFEDELTPERIKQQKYSTEAIYEFLLDIEEVAVRNGRFGPLLDAVRFAKKKAKATLALKRVKGVRQVGQKLRQLGLRR